MIWPGVIGQQRVKATLLSALRTKRLAHAYMFYGGEGVGKDAMALELARVIHCERGGEEACGSCASCLQMNSLQHPDVHLVCALPVGKGENSDDSPTAKLTDQEIETIREEFKLKGTDPYHRITIPRASVIKVNSIRAVRRQSSMSTTGGRRKVFVISDADCMGDESANMLLKTLEEPAGNTMLILTTAHRESLLPTILSRCQNVRFDRLAEQEIRAALVERKGVESRQAELVARLADGSYTRALALLTEDVDQWRKDVLAFVRSALANNVSLVMQAVEKVAELKDRELVNRFLVLLLMWFRDALVLRHGGTIINVDQQEDLNRFLAKFPHADLLQALAHVEQAISLVERNVYIKLAIVNLAIRLKTDILHKE
jgi:DNA polymerase III subunit delta'